MNAEITTRCRVGESMASDYYEHAAECPECEAHEAARVARVRAATPPTGEAERLRDCSCLGSCNGPERLSPRYRCALAPRAPEPAAPVEPPPARLCRECGQPRHSPGDCYVLSPPARKAQE